VWAVGPAHGSAWVAPPPLIQRFIVPDAHVASEGILGETGGHTALSALDCLDGQWATVWAGLGGGAAAAVAVAVDDVLCVDFSGAPDAGDGAAGGEPLAPAMYGRPKYAGPVRDAH